MSASDDTRGDTRKEGIGDPRLAVANIDWQAWRPEQVATLMFVTQAERVLLIRKKRGLGAGKINGPGGRLEASETPLDCAIRETSEELLIKPLGIRDAGELSFHAEDEMPKIHVHVFVASGYRGEPTETDEALPLWFPFNEIPFNEMWEDDYLWLPRVLAGESVRGYFTFEKERLVDHLVEFPSPQKIKS